MQRAQATAGMTRLSLQRLQEVATKDKGLIPRQDIDVAQSRQMEAEAQLASAESSVQAAKDAKAGADQELIRAQTMIGYATIRAPFAGVVTKRYASTGSMIQAGIASQTQAMPVVKLAQNNLLRLILPVPRERCRRREEWAGSRCQCFESRANVCRERSRGRQIQLRWLPARWIPRWTCRIAMAPWFRGMYAEVHLHLAARPNVLSVPLDAVDGLGTSVQQAYVVRDGLVHLVTVKTGLQTPNRLEILSGLQEGDKVIVGRHTGLSDGEHVDAQAAGYENNSKI